MVDERFWSNVRSTITRRVRKKFPTMGQHDVEDAVSDAILALWARWSEYPSTKKLIAEKKTPVLYRYAVMHGTSRACNYLGSMIERMTTEVSFDQTAPEGESTLWDAGFVKPEPSAEDVALAGTEFSELRDAIAELPPEDLQRWVIPLASGETLREQADREGVHWTTVHERRQRGVVRLREKLAA